MKNKKYLAIALCLLLGFLANNSSGVQNALFSRTIMGGPMVALLISMIICNIVPEISKDFKSGTTFAAKKFLNWGIILTGATLNFTNILGGVKALPLIICNIFIAFFIGIRAAKKLNVPRNTGILVGGGTAICGGTAIATIAGIIKAKEEEIAFAMAAIFLFDTLAAFSYPYIAQALSLTENQFAFLAGAAINDASSVAGAQETYKALMGLTDWSGAVTVKLVRTTMLVFVAIAWALIIAKEENKGEKTSLVEIVKKTFPRFILWFLLVALINTFGLLNFSLPVIGQANKFLGTCSKFLFCSALAGVGFKIKFKDVFSKGMKPIAIGGLCWLCVFLFSLAFIFVFAGYVA